MGKTNRIQIDGQIEAMIARRRETSPSYDAWCMRDDMLRDLAPDLKAFAYSVAINSVTSWDLDSSQEMDMVLRRYHDVVSTVAGSGHEAQQGKMRSLADLHGKWLSLTAANEFPTWVLVLIPLDISVRFLLPDASPYLYIDPFMVILICAILGWALRKAVRVSAMGAVLRAMFRHGDVHGDYVKACREFARSYLPSA